VPAPAIVNSTEARSLRQSRSRARWLPERPRLFWRVFLRPKAQPRLFTTHARTPNWWMFFRYPSATYASAHVLNRDTAPPPQFGCRYWVRSSVTALFEHQFGSAHHIGRHGLSLLHCRLLEAIGDYQNMMPRSVRSSAHNLPPSISSKATARSRRSCSKASRLKCFQLCGIVGRELFIVTGWLTF